VKERGSPHLYSSVARRTLAKKNCAEAREKKSTGRTTREERKSVYTGKSIRRRAKLERQRRGT